jgi:hypothetical protein
VHYYIGYPIYIACDLQCNYCFYKNNNFATGDIGKIGITVNEYKAFRNTHLQDAESILVEFCGGETFHSMNIPVIENFLDNTTDEQIDILTNGIQPEQVYLDFINKYKSRIFRMGFSHHRTMLSGMQEELFQKNVKAVANTGVNVYVKEILMPGTDTDFSRDDNISVLVQDFKGYFDKHFNNFNRPKWSYEKDLLVSGEYKKTVFCECTCKPNRKNILITSKWNDGDIIACWNDQVVVGNIKDNAYNKDYSVVTLIDSTKVICAEQKYNKKFIEQELINRTENSGKTLAVN